MRIVFVSYDGLLDPLGQSQILPYLTKLAEAGYRFHIVSFEKRGRDPHRAAALAQRLAKLEIRWTALEFRGGGARGFAAAVALGALSLRRIIRAERPAFVHVRGFSSMVIFRAAAVAVPYIYDFRSFALEEWVDIGKIRADGAIYRALRRLDRRAIAGAAGIVVLEECAKELLEQTYPVPRVPLQVIRTCTDVTRYGPRRRDSDARPLRFVWLGGGRFPYRPDVALRLVAAWMEAGVDCTLTFVNERDHAEIERARVAVGVPASSVRVEALTHAEVPALLAGFDCGLMFIETSRWRRVCSPTKLGEFLAAGLPVIADPHSDACADVARRTGVIRLIDPGEVERGPTPERLRELEGFVRSAGIEERCQRVASEEFSLAHAFERYHDLYRAILNA